MVAGVLINVDSKKTTFVYRTIRNLEGVANVTTVFGRFDMVAMIRALDLDAASTLVNRIREIDGVLATETLIASPSPE